MTARASRRALAVMLAIAVAIVLVGTVLDSLPGTGSTTTTTSSTPSPDTGGADAPTGTAGSPAPPDSPNLNPHTENPDSADRISSEVLPAPDEKSPIGLPPSPPLASLITLPLPETASATGALVPGFPAALIPLNPNSAVQSSSVASAENRLQVTLAATTSTTSDGVIEFYRVAFASNHLVDSVAPAAAGSQALLFSRGADTILLTVTPAADGGTSYSLFGAFTAAK